MKKGFKPNSPDKDLGPLSRQPKESEIAHRSLLLWGMQSPKLRNQRAVGRAVGRAHTTVREYRMRWDWESRCKSPTTETEAQVLYRELYFDKFGVNEITAVQKNIVAPITATTSVPRGVADAVERSIRETKPRDENAFTAEVKRKHLILLDAAIGYIAQGIKEGDIRRTMRDLPLLIQLRSELSGDAKKETGRMLVESVRVSEAKSKGEDVLDAMYEDVCELQAILSSIKSKPHDIDTSHLREENNVQ